MSFACRVTHFRFSNTAGLWSIWSDSQMFASSKLFFQQEVPGTDSFSFLDEVSYTEGHTADHLTAGWLGIPSGD